MKSQEVRLELLAALLVELGDLEHLVGVGAGEAVEVRQHHVHSGRAGAEVALEVDPLDGARSRSQRMVLK